MKLTVTTTRQELLWGGIYMVLELLFLPSILTAANSLLSAPLSASWLNFLFFALNYAVLVVLFRHFLAASFCLLKQQLSRVFKTALLGLLLYWGANLLLGILIELMHWDISNVNDQSIASMARENFPVIALATVFLVPTAEELLYRGVLFQGLYSRSRPAAYLVSTAVFCMIHVVGYIGLYPIQTLLLCCLQYVPAGLCLGWAYVKADSIFTPIFMHTIINALGIFTLR